MSQAGLRLGDILDGSMQGKFDLSTGKGSFLIDRVEIGSKDKNRIDFSGRNLQAEVDTKR